MNELVRTLQRLKRDFDSLHVRWALVGGLAVSARAVSRYTGDVDVAVAVSQDDAAERLAFEMQGKGYVVLAQIENELVGRLGTIRLAVPESVKTDLIVDLLFATAGIEPEAVEDSSQIAVMPNLSLPVASVASLIVFKLVSESISRPQDASDLLALVRASSPAEIESARFLIGLCTQRNFHRQKDLHGTLDRYIDLAATRES